MNKGYAFIEFDSQDDAKKVVQFFNNLDFILRMSSSDQPSKRAKLDGDEVSNKIINNLEFSKLLSMRVMPKKTHQELSQRYQESRHQSLVRAAQYLCIT